MSTLIFKNNLWSVEERINFEDEICGSDGIDEKINLDYPIQDFKYKFNSHGYRERNFNCLKGQPVILCLGDSVTVNIGGPIEHSWPYLLSEMLYPNVTLPVLNLGAEAIGNDSIEYIYKSCCDFFDVKHTFILYGFFHRTINEKIKKKKNILKVRFSADHKKNIEIFEKHLIQSSFYTFLPRSDSYDNEEFEYLLSNHDKNLIIKNYSYLSNREMVDKERQTYVNPVVYNNLKGVDWPSYYEFVNGAEPHSDITDGIHDLPIDLHQQNRDDLHFHITVNQKIAEKLFDLFQKKDK